MESLVTKFSSMQKAMFGGIQSDSATLYTNGVVHVTLVAKQSHTPQ